MYLCRHSFNFEATTLSTAMHSVYIQLRYRDATIMGLTPSERIPVGWAGRGSLAVISRLVGASSCAPCAWVITYNFKRIADYPSWLFPSEALPTYYS